MDWFEAIGVTGGLCASWGRSSPLRPGAGWAYVREENRVVSKDFGIF
jgi:hypothetical protein